MVLRSKNWCFTINNPTPDDIPSEWEGYRYIIYQEEIGAAGTPHYQGYIIFNNAKRLPEVKLVHATAHWEIRVGSHQQAKAYCSKESTRAPGAQLVEIGDEPQQGRRSDLNEVRDMIKNNTSMCEIADAHFGSFIRYYKGFMVYKLLCNGQRNWEPFIVVYYGAAGSGKSKEAFNSAPDAYWKIPGNSWFDGYDGQQSIVMDDFYGSWMPFSLLLRVLDRYPLNVEVKGGCVPFVAKKIILTSNRSPVEWYPNLDLIQKKALLRRLNLVFFLQPNQRTMVQYIPQQTGQGCVYDAAPLLISLEESNVSSNFNA
jgi:hypothetical protein